MSLLLASVMLATSWCTTATITAYNRTDPAMNPYTYDGTSIFTDEPIVAASWSIPEDSIVTIEGMGTFRVADRGHLGPMHFDIAMWSYREAINFGRQYRTVCISPPGHSSPPWLFDPKPRTD